MWRQNDHKINKKKRVYEDFLWALNLSKESQQFRSNICLVSLKSKLSILCAIKLKISPCYENHNCKEKKKLKKLIRR